VVDLIDFILFIAYLTVCLGCAVFGLYMNLTEFFDSERSKTKRRHTVKKLQLPKMQVVR
jgi:hypothetical protein